MQLTLVRHGDACSPTNDLGDHGRCLSTSGRDQARATGRALAERGVAPTHVWCSPLVRAIQTAELVVAELSFEAIIEARVDLYPDSRRPGLLAALSELPDGADVLVVGHMPYIPTLTGELLGMQIGGCCTGAAFRLELRAKPGAGAGVLRWRWLGRFVD